jgi:peptidoglycan/LPS O-acetylase OafA/YrhL
MMVVLFHATGMWPLAPSALRYSFNWGYCGVDFFFVLSGFILLHRHYHEIDHPKKVLKYFGKRFSRIFPAYWAVLAILVPACFLVPGLVSPEKKAAGYIAASFFLLPQWDPFLGVAWSLSCEIFFYLVFALLIINRWSFFAVATVWVFLIAMNLVFPLAFPINFLCQARVFEFLAGMGIAWLIQRNLVISRHTSLVLIGTGICLCLVAGTAQIRYGFTGIVYPLWFGFAAALIIPALISLELRNRISVDGTWLLLGDASYAIYLVHYPVLLFVFKMLHHHLPTFAVWFLAVGTSTGAGIAFHFLIEKRLSDSARVLITRRTKLQSPMLPA